MPAFNHKLYLVTDERACLGRDFFKVVEAAIKGGVDVVQIREKELPEKDFLNKTLRLKEMLDKHNIPLIVNDVLSVAMHGRTAGIHVGNSDLSPVMIRMQWPESVLGYSLEHIDQLSTSHAMVADYIALSPVFQTATKTDTITEWGLDGIREVRSLTKHPLVAIGNIHAGNAAEVISAGADCLAIITAICSANDPERAASVIRNEIERAI
jgi:thiamine-phosphate pyrophosphorylase